MRGIILVLISVMAAGAAPVTRPTAPPAAKPPPAAKQAAPPAAQPAARAPAAVDLSTPTKAAYAYGRALESGNVQAARAVTISTAADEKAIGILAGTASAARKVEEASVARFGFAGHDVTRGVADLFTALLDEGMQEKITGNSATLGPKEEPDVLKFRRVDDGWKLDFTATFPFDEARIARGAPRQAELERILLGAAALIQAGKFKSAVAASETLHGVIQEIDQQYYQKHQAEAQANPPAVAQKPPAAAPSASAPPVATPRAPAVPAPALPKDPQKDPNAIVIHVDELDNVLHARFGGKTFELTTDDRWKACIAALTELRKQKVLAAPAAASFPAFIDEFPLKGNQPYLVTRVCRAAGFTQVEWMPFNPPDVKMETIVIPDQEPAVRTSPPVFRNGKTPGAKDVPKRIVFVNDASATMAKKWTSLSYEIAKAVEGFSADRSFNVIIFQNDKALAASERMLPATTENKRTAYAFLDKVVAAGNRDPLAALRQGMALKPEIIFLLAGGDFPNGKSVLEEVRKLNKDRAVKINTIAFVNDKDTDVEFLDTLKTIAKENGGNFTHINEKQLDN